MSQDFDSYGQIKPKPQPPRSGNSGAPENVEDAIQIPSMIFDQYGEVKALPPRPQPQPSRPNQPAPPNRPPSQAQPPSRPASQAQPINRPSNHAQPLRPVTSDELPSGSDFSVPSMIFDEYGELKALPPKRKSRKLFRSGQLPPPPNQPPAGPARQINYQTPAAPARPGAVPLQSQVRPGQPSQPSAARPISQPHPVIAPAVRPPQPVAPAPAVVKAKPKVAGWVWATLIIAPILLIGLVAGIIIVSQSKPAVTATWAFSGNYPFNLYNRLTVQNDQLDQLYNQGRTALTNRQFQNAQTALEKLRDQQNQLAYIRHPDVASLLFRTYVELADQQYQAAQFSDFQQSLVNLRKAIEIAKTLPVAERNTQEESSLQTRLDTGALYEQAVLAYNQQQLETAAPIFQQLYARDQGFRNASGLYYDTLVKLGDARFAASQAEQAYVFYGRAGALKNVADVRYAQTRAAQIENQLRQAGKPVPTLPAS